MNSRVRTWEIVRQTLALVLRPDANASAISMPRETGAIYLTPYTTWSALPESRCEALAGQLAKGVPDLYIQPHAQCRAHDYKSKCESLTCRCALSGSGVDWVSACALMMAANPEPSTP